MHPKYFNALADWGQAAPTLQPTGAAKFRRNCCVPERSDGIAVLYEDVWHHECLKQAGVSAETESRRKVVLAGKPHPISFNK